MENSLDSARVFVLNYGCFAGPWWVIPRDFAERQLVSELRTARNTVEFSLPSCLLWFASFCFFFRKLVRESVWRHPEASIWWNSVKNPLALAQMRNSVKIRCGRLLRAQLLLSRLKFTGWILPFFFFPVIIWLRGSLYKEKKSDRKPPLRHMKLVRPETYRRFSERHT
jgi:hypothetical protein